MPAKSNKENTPKKEVSSKSTGIKKSSAKPKKAGQEDDFGLEDANETPRKSLAVKSSGEDDDDIVDEIEEDDDNLSKGEEDEDWDPDFNEFDLPKSSKKSSLGKSSKNSDDDYKMDDEFRDLFGSGSSSKKYSDDDDDY